MILTGTKIKEEIKVGNIVIKPFSSKQVNPNSYNYCLGSKLKIFCKFDGEKAIFKGIEIPKRGYILKPGRMYLANTKEVIGSSKYAMSLIGRSSMGRYGLFLQCSANLGHTTSKHKWTLEIVAAMPIKVYPGMMIGQVSFWRNFGSVKKYNGRYGFLNYPQESFTPHLFQKL
jgi:dCTP deaminase